MGPLHGVLTFPGLSLSTADDDDDDADDKDQDDDGGDDGRDDDDVVVPEFLYDASDTFRQCGTNTRGRGRLVGGGGLVKHSV